jgi:hypothetical protein
LHIEGHRKSNHALHQVLAMRDQVDHRVSPSPVLSACMESVNTTATLGLPDYTTYADSVADYVYTSNLETV